MWPFRKKRSPQADTTAIIDEAILFASERWHSFSRTVPASPGTGLRERIAMFARSLEKSLHTRHPQLAAAPDEVIVLIVAKGVEQSGTVSRGEIERALGILLPP
jgi:hypothetical protein